MRGRACLPVVAVCATQAWSPTWMQEAWAQAGGSWAFGVPYPAAVNEVAVVAIGGRIHVLGSVLGGAGAPHQEEDPAAGERLAPPPLPTGRAHNGAAAAPDRRKSCVGCLRRG